MSSLSTAVITIASGRHDHLLRQREGLQRNSVQVDRHIIIAMDDAELPAVVENGPAGPPFVIEHMPRQAGRLPLAAARNRGAELALEFGAEVLILLDVDCIPGIFLVDRYVAAVATAPGPELFSGPVAYLGPAPERGYDLARLDDAPAGHPARPVPPGDSVVPGADHRLFWSLSFALSGQTWRLIGGFCERYDGYGAEDTDFGQQAALCGVGHSWVGNAWAHHQYHPSSSPPVQHIGDIIRNARTFEQRWGWWPMEGWLTAFQRLGLAHYDPAENSWTMASST